MRLLLVNSVNCRAPAPTAIRQILPGKAASINSVIRSLARSIRVGPPRVSMADMLAEQSTRMGRLLPDPGPPLRNGCIAARIRLRRIANCSHSSRCFLKRWKGELTRWSLITLCQRTSDGISKRGRLSLRK